MRRNGPPGGLGLFSSGKRFARSIGAGIRGPFRPFSARRSQDRHGFLGKSRSPEAHPVGDFDFARNPHKASLRLGFWRRTDWPGSDRPGHGRPVRDALRLPCRRRPCLARAERAADLPDLRPPGASADDHLLPLRPAEVPQLVRLSLRSRLRRRADELAIGRRRARTNPGGERREPLSRRPRRPRLSARTRRGPLPARSRRTHRLSARLRAKSHEGRAVRANGGSGRAHPPAAQEAGRAR